MRRHLLYLTHLDPSLLARYQTALATLLPDDQVDVVLVNSFMPGLLSQAYLLLAAELRDGDGCYLPALARRFPAPAPLDAYASISGASFSAGYAFWRVVLTSPQDAERIAMLVGIDSWHVGIEPDGTPSDAGLAQLVAFATRARESDRVLWLGHSDVPTPQRGDGAYSSPTEVAAELVRLVGGASGGFRAKGFNIEQDPRREHMAAAQVWGPMWVRDAFAELRDRRSAFATAVDAAELPSCSAEAAAARQLGALAVNVSLAERDAGALRPPGPESDARRIEYFDGCERDGRRLALKGDDVPHCAAAATWATFRALRALLRQDDGATDGQLLALAAQKGILVPHRRRVSEREIWADLMASHSAIAASELRRRALVPRLGDLWFMRTGHVERVVTFTNGVATNIGANVSGRWEVTARRLDDKAFLGIGMMPRIAAPLGLHVPGDAEVAALQALCGG